MSDRKGYFGKFEQVERRSESKKAKPQKEHLVYK